MNKDQTRRILEAIEECDKFIAKEEPRNASLRPADMAQHLKFCKTHRIKLLGMLITTGLSTIRKSGDRQMMREAIIRIRQLRGILELASA